MTKRRFIRHPSALPVSYRNRSVDDVAVTSMKDVGLGGICFRCREPIDPGTVLELTVPDLDDPRPLRGRVVWCRRRGREYETGLSFATEAEVFHARMVEQVCHIEAYRKRVRLREGRELSSEGAAREWIAKYAHHFPH